MQNHAIGVDSRPPDHKKGITDPTSHPPLLFSSSLSRGEKNERETSVNTTPSLALYVGEKTIQEQTPQVPLTSQLRENSTGLDTPNPPLSSSFRGEKTERERTPFVPPSLPLISPPLSNTAETTATKNQLVDRGDGTNKKFFPEKTPLSSGLGNSSNKIPEEKGEKLSTKKSFHEVVSAPPKKPFIPSGPPNKPAPPCHFHPCFLGFF